jgi:serine/threonine-protein kinase
MRSHGRATRAVLTKDSLMECPACHTPNNDGARFCAKCGALLPAQADEKDPLIGTVVGGRFRISGILGEGGMGRVYTGEQQMGTSVRKVAVKTLLAQYAKDPQVLARFMRECGTVSELEHPNTIKVYDFGQTDSGELYIAMELLSGKSLESVVEAGPMAPERVDRIVQQMCGSLAEAHEKGVVHRDLKPANVYLTTRAGEEDYVKVLDFGIAKKDDKHSKAEQKLTQQGTVLGTPPYMSPEQFRGGELDLRSDIYSLGVMTYEMLTGRLPFDADTPWAWATQHMTAQPFPFETVPIAGSVPPKMKAAVMRALSKDKTQRQQSCKEFAEEISLGTLRMSQLGTRGPSFPDAVSSGQGPSRPGATQMGEPIFPGAPQPAGRTMIDQSASMPDIGGAPAQPQQSVPTGSGQAYPAPAPPAKKGGAGPIIGVVSALLVVGVIATVVVLKKKGTDNGGTTTTDTSIPLPSAKPATSVPADPVSTDPSGSPTTAKSGSPKVPTTVTPPPGPKNDPECDAAIATAGLSGGFGTAMGHYGKCSSSAPNHGAAKAAIGAAAAAAASSKGCGAKNEANQAASIGDTRAQTILRNKKCPGI